MAVNEAFAPPIVPARAAPAPVGFFNDRRVFRRMVGRGALLEFVTVGFYRFWLATDMRRHLWSHTAVGGDTAEYTGTARELLIGFLFAVAILAPIYFVYFLLGLEAERYKAFASAPMGVFFYLFTQFAVYRARRYRLTRTVWRGVRFWMTGSGWNFAWRVGLWTLLVLVTLGLVLPWRAAALERFKMRHTSYGNQRGRFAATGGELFKRGWGLWAIMMAPIVLAIVFGATNHGILAGITAFVPFIAAPFVYPIYKAIEWRWWVDGIQFGEVRFEIEPEARRVDRPLLEGHRLELVGLFPALVLGRRRDWHHGRAVGHPRHDVARGDNDGAKRRRLDPDRRRLCHGHPGVLDGDADLSDARRVAARGPIDRRL